MADINIKINDRIYKIACENGQEDEVQELADQVKESVEGFVKNFGQIGEGRLMLMAALVMADDLKQAKRRLATMEAGKTTIGQLQQSEAEIAAGIEAMSNRLIELAKRLETA